MIKILIVFLVAWLFSAGFVMQHKFGGFKMLLKNWRLLLLATLSAILATTLLVTIVVIF